MTNRVRYLLLLPILSGCAYRSAFIPYEFSPLREGFDLVFGEGFSTPSSLQGLVHVGEDVSPVYSDLLSGETRFRLPSVGEQKILVIPVDFDDSPGNPSGPLALSQAFFGQTGEGHYPSVAAYYDASSYHRFHLSGAVAPSYFRSPYSVSELDAVRTTKKKTAILQNLYETAIAWYDATYPECPSTEFASSDGKGRSFVPVYFVYDAPFTQKEDGSLDLTRMLSAMSLSDPAPIFWSPLSLCLGDGGELNPRLLVHGVGHLLGLPDLHDPKSPGGLSSPLGDTDPMGSGFGDHNPWSKFLLGWIRPRIITGNATLSLRPFADSGDAVLLGRNWNGSLYDEYLLLVYGTPGGLAYVDANVDGGALNGYGLLAYVVDSRLGVYSSATGERLSYLTPSTDLTGKTVDFFASNTGGIQNGDSITGQFLVQLLDASSGSQNLTPHFVAQGKASEGGRDVYFHVGMGMNDDAFEDFTFHSGESLGYAFKVESVSLTQARFRIRPR